MAVGPSSPIPATAALLAREPRAERQCGPYVSLLGSRAHTFFTDGAANCSIARGKAGSTSFSRRPDRRQGNIDLVSIGDYDHPKVRFPGSFGSAYLYYVVPKVILFRVEHSRRTLVPKVDFISAPGGSADDIIASRRADRADHQPLPVRLRSRAQALSPRQRASGAQRRRSDREHRLRFRAARRWPVTPAPSAETLHLMRTVVAPMLAEVYPQFAERVFGIVMPREGRASSIR